MRGVNVVSGILMSLERPVKPGDFVALGELRSVVQSMGGRSTVIRTQDGALFNRCYADEGR